MTSSFQVPLLRAKALPVGLPLNRQDVVFTNLHKRVICCQGAKILVLDSKNGAIIRRLAEHTSDVTQICIRKSNQLQLLSCSLDGTVRLWDYEDGKCLATWNLKARVLSISVSASLPDHALVSLSTNTIHQHKEDVSDRRSRQRKVMLINVNDASTTKGGAAMAQRMVCTLTSTINVRPILHGSCAIMAADKKLLIWDVRFPTIKNVRLEATATALVPHPTESCVVVGDKIGKINFWHCLHQCGHDEEVVLCDNSLPLEVKGHETAMRTSVEHWHAHAVASLAISDDGGYLFSGGEEGVLVQWQLLTHKKDFLPRLMAPINAISLSEDGMLCGICCSDNSVRVFSLTTMKEQWRIRGLALACRKKQHRKQKKSRGHIRLTFDPTSNALVVNDLLGSGKLQFYDVARDQHLTSLRLLPRNLISRMDRSQMNNIVVDWMAFSPDGSSLATVDRLSGARSLKFWSCVYRTDASKVARHFKLDCIVDRPHDKKITALLYHPKRHLVATLSNDQTCKLWGRRDATDVAATTPSIGSKQVQRRVWHCRAVCSYRDYPCSAGAFSHDGSILALAFGATTTLWDPFTNTLLHTLLHQQADTIDTLGFLEESAYLVTSSCQSLVVWNLLTLQVWWSHSLNVLAMAIHPESPRIILATKKARHPQKRKHGERSAPRVRRSNETFLLAFDAASRTPLSYTVLPYTVVSELAYVNLGKDAAHSLVVADGNGMVHLVSWDKDGPTFGTDREYHKSQNSLLRDVFSIPTASGVGKHVAPTPASLKAGDNFEKMLQAPSHILPPPSLMFRVFLKDLEKSHTTNHHQITKKISLPPAPGSTPRTSSKALAPPGIPTSDADLVATVVADENMGSFSELSRLFQPSSSNLAAKTPHKTRKGGRKQKESTASKTVLNRTPVSTHQTPRPRRSTRKQAKRDKTSKSTAKKKGKFPATQSKGSSSRSPYLLRGEK